MTAGTSKTQQTIDFLNAIHAANGGCTSECVPGDFWHQAARAQEADREAGS